MHNNTKGNVENIVSEKEIYTGKYFSCKVLTVETSKGYAQRELIEHNGTIMVIAITHDKKIVLNKVYRKSIDEYSVEIPSKRIDSNDNYLEVIKLEMLEELGYEVSSINSAFNFYPSIAYSNEKVYMYVAEVKKVKDICKNCSYETMEEDIENIQEKIEKLGITDAKTIIGINYISSVLYH